MSELKPCPCGKTPTDLHITDGDTYRWKNVMGNCCNEWVVEARVQPLIGEEKTERDACINAWNEAPRAPAPDKGELARKARDSFLKLCEHLGHIRKSAKSE